MMYDAAAVVALDLFGGIIGGLVFLMLIGVFVIACCSDEDDRRRFYGSTNPNAHAAYYYQQPSYFPPQHHQVRQQAQNIPNHAADRTRGDAPHTTLPALPPKCALLMQPEVDGSEPPSALPSGLPKLPHDRNNLEISRPGSPVGGPSNEPPSLNEPRVTFSTKAKVHKISKSEWNPREQHKERMTHNSERKKHVYRTLKHMGGFLYDKKSKQWYYQPPKDSTASDDKSYGDDFSAG